MNVVDAYQRVNFLDILRSVKGSFLTGRLREKQKVEEVSHSIRAKDGWAVGGTRSRTLQTGLMAQETKI